MPPGHSPSVIERMWLYRLNQFLGPVIGLYWRLHLTGAVEDIPASGPLLVAANHASHLDPWFIGMIFPRPIRYLITHEWYYRSGAYEKLWRAFGTVPVEQGDGRATTNRLCEALERGEVVGIFPEGGISPDGRLRAFRSGIAWTAMKSGAAVIPVGIRGAHRSLPKHRRIPKPTPVEVRVGTRLDAPPGPEDDPSASGRCAAFVADLYERIRALSGAEPAPDLPARLVE